MGRCTVGYLLGSGWDGPLTDAGRVGGELVVACGRHRDLAGPLLAELERRHRPGRRRFRHRPASAEARAICEQRVRIA